MVLNLKSCTLTGADERTDAEQLERLSKRFPFVEWGFLYSPTRQGQPGRYPSIEHLKDTLRSLPAAIHVALHVCGDGVPNLLSGGSTERGLLDLVATRGGRIQLNFNQTRRPLDLEVLAKLLAAHPETVFITQHNAANHGVWTALGERGLPNHAVLFDGSGGRGIPCSEWPLPLPIPCGYAGGLGPANIDAELKRIARVVEGRPTWIDMEGRLRRVDAQGTDWLDLSACEACLAKTQTLIAECTLGSSCDAEPAKGVLN